MSTLSKEGLLLSAIVVCCIGLPLSFAFDGDPTVWGVQLALMMLLGLCVRTFWVSGMGPTIRTGCFYLSLILGIPAILVGFAIPGNEPIAWVVRVGPLVLMAISYAVMSSDGVLGDAAPDFLASICAEYFEADGLCFVPLLQTKGGNASWVIYYQNRYSGPCEASIALKTARRPFRLGYEGISPAHATFRCKGGEVGVLKVPAHCIGGCEGRKCKVVPYARTRFFEGRGGLVRTREGAHHVSGPPSGLIGCLQVALALAGVVVFDVPASFEILIPSTGTAVPPGNAGHVHRVLWSPGDPGLALSLHEAAMEPADVSALAQHYLALHQPASYRMTVDHNQIRFITDGWYVVVKPDRTYVSWDDFTARLAEAEADLLTNQKARIFLRTSLAKAG